MAKFDESGVCDELLWNKFRSGDGSAFAELMRRYSNVLFKYGIRFVQDEDFVKDCIQDVFLELWSRREKISPTVAVKSYILKSLRLRIFREKRKWNATDVIEEDYCFDIEFNIESKIIEAQTNEENRLRIIKLLNSLPKRQKEVLYLRFYEGLDHDKIAQIMELSKQSVYNLLHEATIHMRKAWFEQVHLLLLLFLCNHI